MNREHFNVNVQSKYLEDLCDNATHVSLYLINGIKLSGCVSGVDDTCVLLRDSKNTMTQLIYKHAISTIVPTKTHIEEVE